MKLSFENLGALDRGEIELADLTIVCGENNTGKTYVTYALYCLLKTWKRLINLHLTREFVELRQSGVVRIDAQEKIVNEWPVISQSVLERFHNAFPEMLASKSDLFKSTKLDFLIKIDDRWKKEKFSRELRSGKDRLLVTILKQENSSIVEIAAPKPDEGMNSPISPLGEFIKEALVDMILSGSMPNVFMVSTERTGATTFRNELNLAKNRIIDLLTQTHKDGGGDLTPGMVFETIYRRKDYAMPVDDNVRFTNALPSAESELSSLLKEEPSLLEQFTQIVGGHYSTNKDGATYFQPNGTKVKLGLGEASSAVRSLLIVWYWLKYQAIKGDLLMIDEPELNLHPENQRRMARFIAALVNAGVKVFITTHSDTIIREINTLIMLSRNLSHFEQVRKEHGYGKNEQLTHDKVVLYVTGEAKFVVEGAKNKRTLKTLLKITPDEKLGIDVESFDKTILDMGRMQDDLRYGGE